MTSFSTTIRAYPNPLGTEILESADLPGNPVRHDLSSLLDRYGPYNFSAWAKAEGLQVYYVDNCFVRVPVTGEQLQRFLDAHLPDENAKGRFVALDRAAPHLIEVWEF